MTNRMQLLRFRSAVYLIGAIALGAAMFAPSRANAGFFIFTASGSIDGDPVNAKAEITTVFGQIIIDLFNLQANPDSAGQTISGVSFTTANPLSVAPTNLSQATGDLINIDDDGSYSTPTSANLTRWHMSATTSMISLEGGQPDELIVGNPDSGDVYSAWNGQDQFNPYVKYTAHFVIDGTGVTENTSIETFRFYFGTGPNGSLNGEGGEIAPLPASLVLALTGLVSLGLTRFRRRSRGRPVAA